MALITQTSPAGHDGHSSPVPVCNELSTVSAWQAVVTRPHWLLGCDEMSSNSQMPCEQVGCAAGSQVLFSGHCGSAGQLSAASNAATCEASTAVSLPPSAQPQQSAGTSTQASELSSVPPGPGTHASGGGWAHAQVKQPDASTTKPFAHARSHCSGVHAIAHVPATQAARTFEPQLSGGYMISLQPSVG